MLEGALIGPKIRPPKNSENMKQTVLRLTARLVLPLALVASAKASQTAAWEPVGPAGGDARSFAADPTNPKHIYMGTLDSWVYETQDGGSTWKRLAKLSNAENLVLDNIVVDNSDPKTILVGAWVLNRPDGEIFVTHDRGATWSTLADMHGQSVRALEQARSNAKIWVAGTLKGVYRSDDDGASWKQISPAASSEIHEVESIAIDPVSGVGGLIWPGDRVDVILTQDIPAAGTTTRRVVGETVLSDVRIVAVDQNMVQGGSPTAGIAGKLASTVTVQATANPAPTLTSISPTTAVQYSGAFTMTLTGTGFVAASALTWSGQADLPATTASAIQLTVSIPASYLASVGTPSIAVTSPDANAWRTPTAWTETGSAPSRVASRCVIVPTTRNFTPRKSPSRVIGVRQ